MIKKLLKFFDWLFATEEEPLRTTPPSTDVRQVEYHQQAVLLTLPSMEQEDMELVYDAKERYPRVMKVPGRCLPTPVQAQYPARDPQLAEWVGETQQAMVHFKGDSTKYKRDVRIGNVVLIGAWPEIIKAGDEVHPHTIACIRWDLAYEWSVYEKQQSDPQ